MKKRFRLVVLVLLLLANIALNVPGIAFASATPGYKGTKDYTIPDSYNWISHRDALEGAYTYTFSKTNLINALVNEASLNVDEVTTAVNAGNVCAEFTSTYPAEQRDDDGNETFKPATSVATRAFTNISNDSLSLTMPACQMYTMQIKNDCYEPTGHMIYAEMVNGTVHLYFVQITGTSTTSALTEDMTYVDIDSNPEYEFKPNIYYMLGYGYQMALQMAAYTPDISQGNFIEIFHDGVKLDDISPYVEEQTIQNVESCGYTFFAYFKFKNPSGYNDARYTIVDHTINNIFPDEVVKFVVSDSTLTKSSQDTSATCTKNSSSDTMYTDADGVLQYTCSEENEGTALGHDFSDAACTKVPLAYEDITKDMLDDSEMYALDNSLHNLTDYNQCEYDFSKITCVRGDAYTIVATPKATKTHIWGDEFETITIYPECISSGYAIKEHVCKICGKKEQTAGYILPELGHTFKSGTTTKMDEVEPTCTADGHYTVYDVCDRCNAELNPVDVKIPALGHIWVNNREIDMGPNTIAPTCTTAGKHFEEIICSRCGMTKYEWINDPALGHDWQPKVEVAPVDVTEALWNEANNVADLDITYAQYQSKLGTAKEYTVYKKVCKRCGIYELEIVKPHDCIAGPAIKENVVDPTCTAKGSYDEVHYCTICGAELSREHRLQMS